MKFELSARVERPTGFTLSADLFCEANALGVVGPSGSGKSTLLDAVSGVLPGARVCLNGEDISSLPLHKRQIGYLTQDALLFPHLSVRENLLYSPRSGDIDEVAGALGIGHLLDRRPRHLSGGERRRTALARAILSGPRLLLLDEPFAGLDEARRREAMSLLDRMRRRFGLPIILVSHLAEEVIGLTDWSVRLESGSITAQGPSISVLRAGETRIDNFFTGQVVSPGRVRVGAMELAAMVPAGVTGDVRLGCYAYDILLATEIPHGISARNTFWTEVAETTHAGDATLVRLTAPPLRALVTAESAHKLGLEAGSRVAAILKATSIAYLGAA